MNKTELDIKLNEHLINAAREIKIYCKSREQCKGCIFSKGGNGTYIGCRIGEGGIPDGWEVDNDEL